MPYLWFKYLYKLNNKDTTKKHLRRHGIFIFDFEQVDLVPFIKNF